MKKPVNPLVKLQGLTSAALRFPLTAAFLAAAAALLARSIQTDYGNEKLLLTCVVGAASCAAAQGAQERFFRGAGARAALYAGAAALTSGYYLTVRQAAQYSGELPARTAVTAVALLFAFLWIPVVKSRITFNESFMAAFKALFHSLLYAGVLFGGCAIILAAADNLIVSVSHKAYAHIANIVFVLFFPLFFLSLIPVYPGAGEGEIPAQADRAREEAVEKAAACPKFLEMLISYIVIPLTAVFTVILILYIALNLRGEFWTNNLLEPMLLSYAVTVILVCLLSSGMNNRFAGLFRLVFPKVLIPIVLFQLAASLLKLRDTGVTHGRYFVVLFGLFAVCAGVVMSVLPVRRNGLIAALLIAFSAVSVIPPVDAFTVSRVSQTNRLERALIRNGMLQGGAVVPSDTVSKKDREIIITSTEYLARAGYIGQIDWMPDDFDLYSDFGATFGFDPYELPSGSDSWFVAELDLSQPVDISGYHLFMRTEVSGEMESAVLSEFEHLGEAYVLRRERSGGTVDFVLNDGEGAQVVRLRGDDIVARYKGYTAEKTALSTQEATFTAENGGARLTVIVRNISMQAGGPSRERPYYIDAYLLIAFG